MLFVEEKDIECSIISTIIFYGGFGEYNESLVSKIKSLDDKRFSKTISYVLRAIQSFLDKYKHLPSEVEIVAYMRINIAKTATYEAIYNQLRECLEYSPCELNTLSYLIELKNNKFMKRILGKKDG